LMYINVFFASKYWNFFWTRNFIKAFAKNVL
jgi:hypothetical protein